MTRFGAPPHICLITRGHSDPSNFHTEKNTILETIRDSVGDGVNYVQIREKALPARLLYELVSEALEITRSTHAVLVVNDRIDVAVAARADGVHLPETSFAPGVVRRMFPKELVIGVSTHSIDQAVKAARSGADYVLFGPVFATPGKGSGVGAEALKAVCDALPSFPVIALGGVDRDNVSRVLATGASGIASIRSLNDREHRRTLLQLLNSAAESLG